MCSIGYMYRDKRDYMYGEFAWIEDYVGMRGAASVNVDATMFHRAVYLDNMVWC